VKRDLPEMVAQARKLHDIDFNVLTTLGEADVLLEAIAAWIAAQAAGAKSA
jgi:hypothetical protein